MRKKVKKAISLTLAFLVCLLSIPLNFVQATEMQELYVNGVDILQEEAEMPQGVTYNDGTSTLTLNNANLNTARVNGGITNVIYAVGDLKIKLAGNNSVVNNSHDGMRFGIEVRGNLAIESDGEATLSVNAEPDRSFHVEGNLTIGDGTNATTITTSGEIRVENPGGNILVKANSKLENQNGGISCKSIDGDGIFPEINEPGPGPEPGEPLKLSINGELLIDESAQEPITSAVGTGFAISQLDFAPGYIIDVDTSAINTLGYIEMQGDGMVVLAPTGNLTVNANASGYSVMASDNVFFFTGSGGEDTTISFKGGIKTQGNVFLSDRGVNIGSADAPSGKGIECDEFEVSYNTVKMYSSGFALNNINQVFVKGKAKFEVNSQATATQNVGVIEVGEGGQIDIYQQSGTFDFAPKAAHWPFKNMQGTQEESQEGYVHMPTTVDCVEGTDTTNKYTMAIDGQHFYLKSTAKGMYNISSNIQGVDDSLVVNGVAKVIAANGYAQTFMGYTDYVIEEGTQVTIELLPDYGYQYASGGLNGIPTMPEAGKAMYKFTMPDNHLHLSAIFVRSEDIVSVNSEAVDSATISVAGNDIKGNAKLTIDDKTATQTENQKIKSVSNGMSVGTVLDFKLSEEIAKNGSKTDTWSTNITQLSEDVNIKIKLDEDLSGYENYKIVRIHDGVPEVLNATYNSATGEISFKTDRFSTYAILHSGKQTVSKPVGFNDENITVDIEANEGVLPEGAKVSVQVVSPSTQSSEYKLIKNAVSKIGVKFLPLNITLLDSGGNEIQPNGKLKITVKIPEGYNNPVVCYVNSNGEVRKLNTTIKDGYCTFEVDHLSYYVLVEQQVIGTDNTNLKTNTVKTGDINPIVSMTLLATVSFIAIIIMGCYKKKQLKR